MRAKLNNAAAKAMRDKPVRVVRHNEPDDICQGCGAAWERHTDLVVENDEGILIVEKALTPEAKELN